MVEQQLKEILEILQEQGKTVAVFSKSFRYLMKSQRGMALALRELGANGSVTQALTDLDEAEGCYEERRDELSGGC